MRAVTVIAIRSPVYLTRTVYKVIPVNVIGKSIAIIIHSWSPVQFCGVDPHILGEVRMVVLDTEVDYRDNHFRTSCLESPGILDVYVRTADRRRGIVLAAIVLVMPLSGQLRIVERTGSPDLSQRLHDRIGPSVGCYLQPVVELYPADFLVPCDHGRKAVEIR